LNWRYEFPETNMARTLTMEASRNK